MTQISIRLRISYRRSQFHNVYWLLWKMQVCSCVYVCTDKTLNSGQAVESISTEFQWNPVKNSSRFNYLLQSGAIGYYGVIINLVKNLVNDSGSKWFRFNPVKFCTCKRVVINIIILKALVYLTTRKIIFNLQVDRSHLFYNKSAIRVCIRARVRGAFIKLTVTSKREIEFSAWFSRVATRHIYIHARIKRQRYKNTDNREMGMRIRNGVHPRDVAT